LTATNTRKQG